MTTSYPNTRDYAKTKQFQQATELLKMTTEPPAGGADALNEQDLTNILNQVPENQLQGLRLLEEDNKLARNIEAAQKEQARNKATAALSGISEHPNDASSNTLSH